MGVSWQAILRVRPKMRIASDNTLLSTISSPDARSSAISQVAMYWYSSDPAGASAWVNSLPRGEDRDNAIVASVNAGLQGSEAVQDLIATIDDPERRKQATMMSIQMLMFSDRAAAERLIKETEMTDEEREQLRKRFRSVGSNYGMSID